MEEPSKKFHRLSPGGEVRLRYGYIIKCNEVIKNAEGEVVELHCTIDPETKSGASSERRVKGTIHWVSLPKSVPVEVRLYDRLFNVPNPDDVAEGNTFLSNLNPDSKTVLTAHIEPAAAAKDALDRYQFERQGFFFLDEVELGKGKRVWNRTITLRDTWEKPKQTAVSPSKPAQAKTQAPVPERDPFDGLSEAAIERAKQLEAHFGIGIDDAAILAVRPKVEAFFREASGTGESPTAIANWLINELRPLLPENGLDALPFSAVQFAELVGLHSDETLSSRLAKDVLAEMLKTGASPGDIVDKRGLKQISDEGQLSNLVREVLAAFPDRVEAYKSGKVGLMGFFMGQVMAKTGGKANPGTVKSLMEKALS